MALSDSTRTSDRRPRRLAAARAAVARVTGRGSFALFAVLALVALTCVGLASASPVTDPGEVADTDYTPVPHPTAAKAFGWQQVGGAVFDTDQARDQARAMGYEDKKEIPHTVDFFAISFIDSDRGFAGGAKCKQDIGAVKPGSDGDTQLECERVPALYEYSRPTPNEPPVWKEVALPDEGNGFIGAIAWVNAEKAVAVGGTGCYPRREVVPTEDAAVDVDGDHCTNEAAAATDRAAGRHEPLAGDARAWVMQEGAWKSITNDLPAGMTALTALAFSPRLGDCSDPAAGAATSECGLAGGLGQLWTWRDGSFLDSATSNLSRQDAYLHGTKTTPADADFPFRVRDIVFRPSGDPGTNAAVVVTSGCCWHDPATGLRDPRVNFPRILRYNSNPSSRTWTVTHALGGSNTAPGRARTLQDSAYAVDFGPARTDVNFGNCATVALTSGAPAPGAGDPTTAATSPDPEASRVLSTCGVGPGGVLVTDPNVPEGGHGNTTADVHPLELSSIRLVAGGGDVAGHEPNFLAKIPTPTINNKNRPQAAQDGWMDWAVGEWSSNRQAVAYTTTTKANGLNPPYPLDCPPEPLALGVHLGTDCKVDAQGTLDQIASDSVFLLPSYPLSAYSPVGQTGLGWAAGDRGALLRLGASERAATAGDLQPPKLGSGEPTRLSSREAYDPFRFTLSDEPGLVPALHERPLTEAPSLRLIPWGSPTSEADGSIQSIVMSPDGREGWALGPNAGGSTSAPTVIAHFDGTRWAHCDPGGIRGLLPPDAACEGLREVSEHNGRGVRFLAMARVPAENADEDEDGGGFEMVALATYRDRNGSSIANPPPVVLRYRGNRWAIDQSWSAQLGNLGTESVEMAFTGPHDGWLVANNPIDGQAAKLFRLNDDSEVDGGRWVACPSPATAAPQCGDPKGILPTSRQDAAPDAGRARGLRLTAVGSRVYLYGTRLRRANNAVGADTRYPVILSLDSRSGEGEWRQEYDPLAEGRTTESGFLNALSVARLSGGRDEDDTGWAVGGFGGSMGTRVVGNEANVTNEGATPLLRLDPAARRWAPVADPGAAAKAYLLPGTPNEPAFDVDTSEIVALPGRNGSGTAVASQRTASGAGRLPNNWMVWLNPASRRWEAFATPFSMRRGPELTRGNVNAMAPDNQGGAWLAAQSSFGGGAWFYRFHAPKPEPVFEEAAHPIREEVTGSAAGGDGSVWVTGASGTVYRFDRLTGWDRVALKGWDTGGVVQSPAYAVAVGPDGEGFVVGKSGRIARVGPRSVALDPAAVLCSADGGSCATRQTLRSVAVAPDGSALAGGERRALIWRPAGGSFRAVSPPEVGGSSTISGISMPAPDRAWLVTSNGEVMAGRLAGGGWSWSPEARGDDRRTLSRNRSRALALKGVAIDAGGHGFAVGDEGVILERVGDGGGWRRVPGFRADLSSVTLGPGGRGALIGGSGGLILTRVGDRFEVARHDDQFDPLVQSVVARTLGQVVGVSLLPGARAGQVEAWAFVQNRRNDLGTRFPPPWAVLHYASDADEPLLDGGAGRVRPLPDTPARVDGELVLAAFGKSDCQRPGDRVCPEPVGTAETNQLVLKKVREELTREGGRPDLAILTGDANDVGGSRNRDVASVPVSSSVMHERWWESVGGPLERAGVPLFGALGGQDLSYVQACDPLSRTTCEGSRTTRQKVGTSFGWRQAFAGARFPWGPRGDKRAVRGLKFDEVEALGVEPQAAPVGGARTHYAVDVRRNGKDVLRLVVVDTSLKSVSGTAALQNPVREQVRWLDEVLQRDRDPERLPAVVVSETPSYAYEARAGATTDTLVDSAAFEAVLVKNRVTAVVSGRLGWNGLYWLVAPGLHAPCPGGSYQADPPRDASQLCEGSQGPAGLADRLAGELEDGLGRPVPKPSSVFQNVAGQLANIPVAVAASAGGRFGPNGEGAGSGSQGFWRGYTRVRIFPGKDLVPVVEQRPVFDWIGLHASEHTLTPGRRLALRGFGREPLGTDVPARYVDIDGPAITHRYDLVLADPDRPHLPKVDPTSDEPNHYVPVPEEVGASIDRQSGVVRYAGRGNQAPVYALAILSVGEKAASWPIVFAPRRSFRAPPPARGQRIVLPPPPRPLGTPLATLPPVPPVNPLQPPTLNLTFPPSPGLPNLQLQSPQAQPPAPPAPPPPPVSPAASALQINAAPVGLNVAPAATVIPPPAPPIQPAPPGGARREARQRQAAAAKSEEGSTEGQDAAKGEGTQAATRHDPGRDLAFARYTERTQPSAWTNDALPALALGLGGLVLALGWQTLRPRPRPRPPEIPAPAWARNHHRRRP